MEEFQRPLSEWTIEDFVEAYGSPYAPPYSMEEIEAELIRRYELTPDEARDVPRALRRRGIISEEDWEYMVDFWDNGLPL
jgi:hypothetical protein